MRVPRLYGKFNEKLKEYMKVKDSLSCLSKMTSEMGDLVISVEEMPEWIEFVGEHGSLEQKVVNEILAKIDISQKNEEFMKRDEG
jgi:hypothetical protein